MLLKRGGGGGHACKHKAMSDRTQISESRGEELLLWIQAPASYKLAKRLRRWVRTYVTTQRIESLRSCVEGFHEHFQDEDVDMDQAGAQLACEHLAAMHSGVLARLREENRVPFCDAWWALNVFPRMLSVMEGYVASEMPPERHRVVDLAAAVDPATAAGPKFLDVDDMTLSLKAATATAFAVIRMVGRGATGRDAAASVEVLLKVLMWRHKRVAALDWSKMSRPDTLRLSEVGDDIGQLQFQLACFASAPNDAAGPAGAAPKRQTLDTTVWVFRNLRVAGVCADRTPDIPKVERVFVHAGIGYSTYVTEAYLRDNLYNDARRSEQYAWLNDELTSTYMILLQIRQDGGWGLPGVACRFFNTFYLTSLCVSEASGYDEWRGQRRARRFPALGTLNRLFFPVHESQRHWMLAVVFVDERTVCFYDSLGSEGKVYVDRVIRFMTQLCQTQKLEEPDRWERTKCQGPPQYDGYNCGMHMCLNADWLSMQAGSMSEANDMWRQWYSTAHMNTWRREFRDFIRASTMTTRAENISDDLSDEEIYLRDFNERTKEMGPFRSSKQNLILTEPGVDTLEADAPSVDTLEEDASGAVRRKGNAPSAARRKGNAPGVDSLEPNTPGDSSQELNAPGSVGRKRHAGGKRP